MSSASLAWPVPGSRSVVRMNSGSAQPCLTDCSVICLRTAATSSNLVGLTMIAARRVGDSDTVPSGRKSLRCGRRPHRRPRWAPPTLRTRIPAHPAMPRARMTTSTIAARATQPECSRSTGRRYPTRGGRIRTGQSACPAPRRRAIGRFPGRSGVARLTFGRLAESGGWWRLRPSAGRAVDALPWSPCPTSPPMPTAIVPDTKDWTWTLQRPCPDCGFDARTRGRRPTSRRPPSPSTSPWTAVLQRPEAAQRPAPDGLVTAGVRLPRARRLPGLRRAGRG